MCYALAIMVSVLMVLPIQAMSWERVVADSQDESVRLAVNDLRRYLAQVTGRDARWMDVASWESSPSDAVIVGQAADNAVIASLKLDDECAKVHDDGYVIACRKVKGVDVVAITAPTSRGVVNAVYGLLFELGYRFYLGSESVPGVLPTRLHADTVVRSPRFKVRGVLPWYNFFNSPTTWDPVDHRAVVDQLIRSGANFIGFHTYDSEPFAPLIQNGQVALAERLLNTASPTWGTKPVRTEDFAAGTNELFDQPFFGAESTQREIDRVEAIHREQAILHDAFEYAHARGLQTCLGFEISQDPTDPAEREAFTARLKAMLKTYPMLDYVWLWQPETQGVQGFRPDYHLHILPGKPSVEGRLTELATQRRGAFKRVVDATAGEGALFKRDEAGKQARAMEGARLEQYALLAHDILKRESPHTRLVMAGWGGDERLLSAEYYEGLDKLLPKDVVFASLDHIFPRERVDRAYHDLPADRERWPIPWLELDGDQWQPQAAVYIYDKMMRDIASSGSQGVLGIHWRTRDIEENFGFVTQFAWNPVLSAHEFFQDLAAHAYDADIASSMADIHEQLDALGYRWVGGDGQIECGEFRWEPGTAAKATELERLLTRSQGLLPKARTGRDRLEWMIHRMEFALDYWDFETRGARARDLLKQAVTDPARAKELAMEAQKLLNPQILERALHHYAQRVTTRGEYGVLATINCKAVPGWRDLLDQCGKLSPTTAAVMGGWSPEPMIVVPRLYTSAAAGKDLEIRIISLGGARSQLRHAPLGEDRWDQMPMQGTKGWVQRAVVPAGAMNAPGVKIEVSLPNAGREVTKTFCLTVQSK
jgi:hypothetical protein